MKNKVYYGFAVFLSQASGFNKISKISKIFIEIDPIDTFDPIKDLDMNKTVAQFSLMCSGTYHTTPVVHDIFLHDSIEFKKLCNQITLTIEWDW